MGKPFVAIVIIVGIVLIIISCVYVIEPANKLPAFFPGFDPHLTKHHLTHATAAFVLGVAAFVLAWFKSGKKSAHEEKK